MCLESNFYFYQKVLSILLACKHLLTRSLKGQRRIKKKKSELSSNMAKLTLRRIWNSTRDDWSIGVFVGDRKQFFSSELITFADWSLFKKLTNFTCLVLSSRVIWNNKLMLEKPQSKCLTSRLRSVMIF